MKGNILTITAVALLCGCSEPTGNAPDGQAASEAWPPAPDIESMDVAAGERLASQCRDCHGEDGVSRTRFIPHLSGQRLAYLIGELDAYKQGARDNPAMHAVARSFDDKMMGDVAAYYARHNASDDSDAAAALDREVGPPPLPAAPSTIKWVQKCNRCHDDSGFSDHGRFPVLTGQREEYLAYAMHAYQDKFPRDNSMMHAMTEMLSTHDIDSLARFYAHRSARDRVGEVP